MPVNNLCCCLFGPIQASSNLVVQLRKHSVTCPCSVMYLCTAVKFSVNAVWISKTRRLLALLQYIEFQMPYDTEILKIFFRWSNRGETPLLCTSLLSTTQLNTHITGENRPPTAICGQTGSRNVTETRIKEFTVFDFPFDFNTIYGPICRSLAVKSDFRFRQNRK